MLKVTENPNCKNDFKNIAAEHVTQFSHKLQVTDEAFYADSERNNENLFLATNQVEKVIFQTASIIKIVWELKRKKKKKKVVCNEKRLQV